MFAIKSLAWAAVVISLCGCAAAPAPRQAFVSLSYDPLAHSSYQGDGSGWIKGQAFLRQKGGGVVTCAGSRVFAMPATPYFRQVLEVARAAHNVSNLDPAAKSLAKQGMCDAQGNFLVTKLRPGAWLVTTGVEWSVGYQQQGGGLLKEVEVRDGQESNILMTDTDFYSR